MAACHRMYDLDQYGTIVYTKYGTLLHYLFIVSVQVWVLFTGVDMDVARNKERMLMFDDANQWLISGKYTEMPHYRTGAMALHIAAAKGYADVIKLVLLQWYSWFLSLLKLNLYHFQNDLIQLFLYPEGSLSATTVVLVLLVLGVVTHFHSPQIYCLRFFTRWRHLPGP